MMDWISDGLKSLLLMEEAFATQNFASFGRYSSHGIARVPWNSSSKVSAWKLPTFKSTRSVVLRKILADRLRVADKCHTPVFHLADLISKVQDFFFHHCLQAEMAWDDQFKCIQSDFLRSDVSRSCSRNCSVPSHLQDQPPPELPFGCMATYE